LAESSAINRYLARKANLHGDNEEEAAVIDQFASNWIDLLFKGRPARNLKDSNPEQYNVEYPKYLDTELKPALNKHEEYLATSASGYYVGDKVSIQSFYSSILSVNGIIYPLLIRILKVVSR
jgi:glutathione S-transferase